MFKDIYYAHNLVDLANVDNCGDRVCGDLYDENTISKELDEIKKSKNNFTINNNMNNHNYSIQSIVDNYNERWNTNLTVEEYLKNFTRKHRGAC